jgi:hypothetical protein
MVDNNTDLDTKIQIILRQTNYTETEAEEKLMKYNNDPLLVIKDFLGIKERNENKVYSVNQEIYRQLRHKLDSSMMEYKSRKECDKSIK